MRISFKKIAVRDENTSFQAFLTRAPSKQQGQHQTSAAKANIHLYNSFDSWTKLCNVFQDQYYLAVDWVSFLYFLKYENKDNKLII